MTFGLIRHGITEWNSLHRAQGLTDIPLSEIGQLQTEKLAKKLVRDEEWDIIVTSPLVRAKTTAEIISYYLNGITIVEDKGFIEMDCGLIEGTTEEERRMIRGINWKNVNLAMEPTV